MTDGEQARFRERAGALLTSSDTSRRPERDPTVGRSATAVIVGLPMARTSCCFPGSMLGRWKSLLVSSISGLSAALRRMSSPSRSNSSDSATVSSYLPLNWVRAQRSVSNAALSDWACRFALWLRTGRCSHPRLPPRPQPRAVSVALPSLLDGRSRRAAPPAVISKSVSGPTVAENCTAVFRRSGPGFFLSSVA